MTHFAKVTNGIVEKVIVTEPSFLDSFDGEWIQTSYNTRGGVHYSPDTKDSDGGIALRKNYAGVGFTYDLDRDAFIPPKPYNSWTLDEASCSWESPIPQPADSGKYTWNEETQSWDLIEQKV